MLRTAARTLLLESSSLSNALNQTYFIAPFAQVGGSTATPEAAAAAECQLVQQQWFVSRSVGTLITSWFAAGDLAVRA